MTMKEGVFIAKNALNSVSNGNLFFIFLKFIWFYYLKSLNGKACEKCEEGLIIDELSG